MLDKSAKNGDGLIGSKDEKSGDSALHLASESGSKETIQAIISRGADISAPNASGQTALHLATKRNLIESVKTLLAAGGNIRSLDGQKKTPMWYAIRNQEDSMFTLLLDHGISLEEDVSPLGNPLHECCHQGYSKGVAILLKRGAKIDKKHPTTENTPLHVAAMSGSSASVLALLGFGGNKEAENKLGFKPQNLALQAGHRELAEVISKYVFDPNHKGFADLSLSETKRLEMQKDEVEKKISQLTLQRSEALKNGDNASAKKILEQTHELEEKVIGIEEAILTLEEKELEEREQQNRLNLENKRASLQLLPENLSSHFRGSVYFGSSPLNTSMPSLDLPPPPPLEIPSTTQTKALQPSPSILPPPPEASELPPLDL
eukprot:TRINITY_DN1130_c0_g1_i2.p1 TRINITY_DN1130_c0_g1~~TRINITY_DN1130_c0_g1_i2.p1  ORF type:complete len:376 (+),score=137.89 TRINITY_DN1130_c0_g1_i2:264-1391(+)